MAEKNRARNLDWNTIGHFVPEEFDDPLYPGSWGYMDPITIKWLDEIREQTGWMIETHNKFGIRGCVCVEPNGHTSNSRHYSDGSCDAVDWHFVTKVDARIQADIVISSKFTGVGVYYDWHWDGGKLAIGFHTDRRPQPQYWQRDNGQYFYLLK